MKLSDRKKIMRMFEKEGPGTIQIGLNSRNAKRMLRFEREKKVVDAYINYTEGK
jgi:hypothetical protein